MTLSLDLWILPLVVGLGLLFLGWLWRAIASERRQRRARELLNAALNDPDPLVRLAAVQVAVQQGIAPVAADLLQATRVEQHPAVLEGITEAVARHQWEPSLEPELLELRLWAQRRLVEVRQEEREGLPHTNGVVHEAGTPPPPPPATGRVIGWLLGERQGAAPPRKRS